MNQRIIKREEVYNYYQKKVLFSVDENNIIFYKDKTDIFLFFCLYFFDWMILNKYFWKKFKININLIELNIVIMNNKYKKVMN